MIVGFLIGYLCFQSYVNGDDRYGTSQGTYEYGSSLTNARGVSKAEYSEENMPKILLMGLRRYWPIGYTQRIKVQRILFNTFKKNFKHLKCE